MIASVAFLVGGWGACASSIPQQALRSSCADETAVDVLHHDIELSLRLDPPSLAGRGMVRIKARRATSYIVLNANLRVTEVMTDAGQLHFQLENGRLCAMLPQVLPPGAELSLKLAWDVPTDRKTPAFSRDEVWAGYHASAWMPTRQDPAQRATLALRIFAPSDLKVVASGQELAQRFLGDSQTVHSFVLDRPSPPFLFAFAAGRFDEATLDVDGLKLRALGPPGSDLKGALAVTAHAYGFLAGQLRSRLPTSVYSQVFVHGNAAQEAAGLALLSASYLDDLRQDPTEDWVFTHELAHQWFAWLVPCADFADFWLNEGFATFLVAAVKEQRWGRLAYERELNLWHARSAKVHTEGRDAPHSASASGAPSMPPLTESQLPPRGVTYARGALFLHRLRSEIGDGPFWDGLRLYVRKHADKGARSEDLRRSIELASGVDLRAFFARWVYANAPDI